MAVQTGLDYMRSRTSVDCDTMDDEGINFFKLIGNLSVRLADSA